MSRINSARFILYLAAAGAAGCLAQADGDAENPSPEESASALTTADPTAMVADAAELARMRRFIEDRIDRAAIRKTLKSEDGRDIHCVDIDAQPAHRNPLLKGHRVQRAPSAITPEAALPTVPLEAVFEPLGTEVDATAGRVKQVWSCPEDTVPVPELKLEDVARFGTLRNFHAKLPDRVNPGSNSGTNDGLLPPAAVLHQHVQTTVEVTNWGGIARISAYVPAVATGEFSLGQIWVEDTNFDPMSTTHQTVEVGLQKYPNLYNDSKLHLFIYSTRDGYRTGCYNNSCGDFVQVSTKWYPGTAIGTVATIGGTQYQAGVQWFKDMDNGAWWLNVEGNWVGYYPHTLFTSLKAHAGKISWGGEVADLKVNNLHTTTDMGSGRWSSEGYGKAAYMNNVKINHRITANPSTVWNRNATLAELDDRVSDSLCYDIEMHSSTDPNWGTYFYYGGPGYNEYCDVFY